MKKKPPPSRLREALNNKRPGLSRLDRLRLMWYFLENSGLMEECDENIREKRTT